MSKESFFIKAWYENHPSYKLLLPLTWVFCVVRYTRTALYRWGILSSVKVNRPVVVVGNITVGGTGKTMLIIDMVEKLRANGYTPGVVSRGYSGQSPVWPLSVTAKSDPLLAGDEPVVIARKTQCPVVVGPDRVEDCEVLIHRYPECDVILSDDGLQHYHMQRDYEIAVFDGERVMGNCHCLPAGPLREPPGRLDSVDKVVVKGADSELGERMDVVLEDLYDIENPEVTRSLESFRGRKVHAIAGIGNPHLFFEELREFDIEVLEHEHDDHHVYTEGDLKFQEDIPIIVTEKDAVKIQLYHPGGVWALPVRAKMADDFYDDLLAKLKELHGTH